MPRDERDKQDELHSQTFSLAIIVLILGAGAILLVWTFRGNLPRSGPVASETSLSRAVDATADSDDMELDTKTDTESNTGQQAKIDNTTVEAGSPAAENSKVETPCTETGPAERSDSGDASEETVERNDSGVSTPAGDQANVTPPTGSPRPQPGTHPFGVQAAHLREQWWHGSTKVSWRLFLYDRVDAGGLRRRGYPAPIGERYVIVSTSLRWDGKEVPPIVISADSSDPPTLRLRHEGTWFAPLGRLQGGSNSLNVLSTHPTMTQPGETVDVEVAFIVPESIESVSLVVGGVEGDVFELPPGDPIDVQSLIGRWRKSPGQLAPIRYAAPFINAISDDRGELAIILRNRLGFTELTLPGASIISNPLNERSAAGNALALTLSRGTDVLEATLRTTDDGDSFLLYASADQAVFLFERVRD